MCVRVCVCVCVRTAVYVVCVERYRVRHPHTNVTRTCTSFLFPSKATYIGQRKQLAGVVANDPGTVTFTNHTVKCTAYGGAANNFTFCKHDAGHCWPGHQAQGPCTMDVDASAQIWQFFTRYRLPAPASLEALLPQRPAVTETHNY